MKAHSFASLHFPSVPGSPPLVENPGCKSFQHSQMRNSPTIVPTDRRSHPRAGEAQPNLQSINMQTICAQMQPLMAEGALPVIPHTEQITIVLCPVSS